MYNRVSELFYPQLIIEAYREGFFPMADSKGGEIYWHSPDPRAIFPLDKIKPPKSLRKILNKNVFNFSINEDFERVINKCADRDETWISGDIINSYLSLHDLGYAHSVETWKNGELVGGLYGVAIGGAFFGESMFNTVDNSSKSAFYFLSDYLKKKGFLLLDSQYINDFTRQLGAIEIPRILYLKILQKAIKLNCKFD